MIRRNLRKAYAEVALAFNDLDIEGVKSVLNDLLVIILVIGSF